MKKIHAFTLIELLIVVAIIAILAAIAVPNFLEAQVRAKVSRVKADQRTLITALESYYVDANRYPPEGTPWGLPGVDTTPAADMTSSDYVIGACPDSSRSLSRLTTPIAYISSVAVATDPFMTGVEALNRPLNVTFRLDHMFYTNYEQFGLVRGHGEEPSFVGYGLASLGPDHADDGALYRLYNIVAYPDQQWAIDDLINGTYDPTNGTVSWGDIARFGGAVPASASVIEARK